MENENNFKETVSSLFKGMDGFVSAKTVVGDAIHVGDTIILPLVDALVHLQVIKRTMAAEVSPER